MFGYMTMSHPITGITGIQENIHRISGRDQDRVLPGKIIIPFTIDTGDEESLSMKMNRVLHGVRRFRIIRDMDFDLVTLFEIPVYIHIFFLGLVINHLPSHIFRIRHLIHHLHHAISRVPFDTTIFGS